VTVPPLRFAAAEPRSDSNLEHPVSGSWTADGRYYVFQSTRYGESNLWQLDERPRLFARRTAVQITNGPLSYQAPITAQTGDAIYFIGLNTRSELLGFDTRNGLFMPMPASSATPGVSSSRGTMRGSLGSSRTMGRCGAAAPTAASACS
jgi:Tol biopolymer transport system component